MKAKDIRALNDAELTEKIGEFRKELFNLRFQHATSQLENTQRLPQVKRTIARLETIRAQRASEAKS